jgi:D-glycero-alpha-D-manno-heptose-7-phosphate kinase
MSDLPDSSESIVMRAPTRIDFGGGWTDVPPYSEEMGGYVCNVAITRYATVTVTRDANSDASGSADAVGQPGDRSIAAAAARRFHVPAVRIGLHCDFPSAAGLGGSSAVGVATVAALAAARDEVMTPSGIAELSRDIETVDLGIAGGRQDHYAAVFGGALGLRFAKRGVDVRNIPLSAAAKDEIERRCIVIYTGQSRISGDTIIAVLDAYRRKEPSVLHALHRMKATAEQMPDALAAGDIDLLGRLVADQWQHQRALHPAIPTARIDEIIARARGAGSVGAKALGASGGGCVLVIAKRDRVEQVRDAIAPLGDILSFAVAEHGVERCR